MAKLTKLHLEDWRQYQKVDIDFHNRLTILTGANGSGKTTIINVIGQLLGWGSIFTATPITNSYGALTYLTGLWKNNTLSNNYTEFGFILFSDGSRCNLSLANHNSAQYNINYSWVYQMGQIFGIYIQSHRPTYRYAQVSSIPTTIRDRTSAYNDYFQPIYNIYNNGYGGKSPVLSLKESLISMAALGYGNKVIVPNQEGVENFERFQNILLNLLPKSLGFSHIEIRMPEVVLVTKSGDFSIDSVSGGIASIIDIAWRIFTYNISDREAIITIDEPENHLHPELQRTILGGLLKAFPKCQFVVATHSPFIISSSEESSVYALNFNDRNRVYSEKLDLIDNTSTASQILRDVLGLESTLPIWVEDKLEEITRKFSDRPVSEDTLKDLKSELERQGMQEMASQVVLKLIQGSQDDQTK